MTRLTIWEERHASAPEKGAPPSPFIERWARQVWAGERDRQRPALDIACGSGRHLPVLATAGWTAVGVDFSREAVRRSAIRSPGARLVVADAAGLPFRPRSFALVVLSRFLDRAQLPRITDLLEPGGVLLIETFLEEEYHAKGHPSLRFCLGRGEIARLLVESPQSLVPEEIEEGLLNTGADMAHLARISARRPAS